MSKEDALRDAWGSLGIAFNARAVKNANPEETIIATIKSGEFPQDKKMFSLMLLWMNEYHDMIHVERLKVRTADLVPFELATLGAIAKKMVVGGDHRFKSIVSTVEKKLGTKRPVFEHGDDEVYLKIKGVDEDFMALGIHVAPLLPENSKKLMDRCHILKNNEWLKNRLLFGPNLRADFVTVYNLKLATNAYKAAKFLGCSMNAAYRNWNDLLEARELAIF